MRYLGIDYGSKKVGLALSDEGGNMGFPHRVVPNTPRLIDDLLALIAKENVATVVVGESKNLDGSDNPIAVEAKAFATTLTERSGTPVVFESEIFTTAEAKRSPEELPPSRSPRSREPVDASAAALILTSYLSKHHA